jgi:hypothetical protein
VAYWMKYWDASHALSLKKSLVDYDRTLVIADPRRMEPKKFGGGGARARRQKRCILLFMKGTGTDLCLSQLPINGCTLSLLASFMLLTSSMPPVCFINANACLKNISHGVPLSVVGVKQYLISSFMDNAGG